MVDIDQFGESTRNETLFPIRRVNLARLFFFILFSPFFFNCIFSLLLVDKCSISWYHVETSGIHDEMDPRWTEGEKEDDFEGDSILTIAQ